MSAVTLPCEGGTVSLSVEDGETVLGLFKDDGGRASVTLPHEVARGLAAGLEAMATGLVDVSAELAELRAAAGAWLAEVERRGGGVVKLDPLGLITDVLPHLPS